MRKIKYLEKRAHLVGISVQVGLMVIKEAQDTVSPGGESPGPSQVLRENGKHTLDIEDGLWVDIPGGHVSHPSAQLEAGDDPAAQQSRPTWGQSVLLGVAAKSGILLAPPWS